MKTEKHIDDPDIILIGSGIMSATLGVVLKELDPELKIQVYEAAEGIACEASDGWHNAGTGHAGLCELSYTPDYTDEGEVNVEKAIDIFQEFTHSLQFWGYAARKGIIEYPTDCVNPVPHLSFVHGKDQVNFLRSRYLQMKKHHFFKEMEYTEDREIIREWAPLILEGRDNDAVAMTRMPNGTDVNFGALASELINWLSQQKNCGCATLHRVTDLEEKNGRWSVEVASLKQSKEFITTAGFVFIGAGGGSLSLLQKSGIPQAKGLAGFPIGGQWLVSESPNLVRQHNAKVYGISPGSAPTMAVPHLDTRIINGKKSLLFGPYASWTTKFLHEKGSVLDLPLSIRADNILSLIKVGISNIPLVFYLLRQGTQSMKNRLSELRSFYPAASGKDWKLIDAGIRVQAIKKEDGDAGIVHFGTEVMTNNTGTLSALLGASPGASVSTNIALNIIQKCFPNILQAHAGHSKMKELIPSYDEDLRSAEMAQRQEEVCHAAAQALKLEK